MDLPAHVLYTYAFEKIVTPKLINNHDFVISSLIFSALPDLIETIPFLTYVYINKKKYRLEGLKSVIVFTSDITHNKTEEYERDFAWAAKISFYSHSFLIYLIIAIFLFFIVPGLCLPFIIGYGLHLFADIFAHDDYFSARPFYPISNYSIPGLFTWYKSKKFTIYNYCSLFVLYIIILFLI